MRLKNVLVVVGNMDRAVAFYKELFGLNVILDRNENVMMTEGLVLQDKKVWEKFTGKKVISENNASELYFEEADIEGFVKKLEAYREPVLFANRLTDDPWGRKMVRFYDPDGNLIEVGTPAKERG